MTGRCCPTCAGSGVFYEQHEQGMVEQLGCPDCEATGYSMCFDRHFCCDDTEHHQHFLSAGECPSCRWQLGDTA